MKPRHPLPWVFVFLAAGLPVAHASNIGGGGSDHSPTFSLGAFGGGHLFGAGTALGAPGAQATDAVSSTGVAGLRMSLGIGRWVTAEAELAGLATTDRQYGHGANVLGYHVNGLANLLPGDFRPFVLLGAGAMQVVSTAGGESGGLRRDTEAEFHVGVGFDYRVIDGFSLRGGRRGSRK